MFMFKECFQLNCAQSAWHLPGPGERAGSRGIPLSADKKSTNGGGNWLEITGARGG